FAVLPLRAAHQPFINESAISACENGTIEARCTFSKETARRLVGAIQREQYGGNPIMVRRAEFSAQLQMLWLYFKWQWFRDVRGSMPVAQSLIAASMLVLGLFGLAAMRRVPETETAPRTRSTAPYFWYFATLAVCFTIALVFY